MNSLLLTGSDYAALHEHLFRSDRDEYGAIVLAGRLERSSATGFLGRELHLLDETEFIPGEFGYRQIAPHVLARLGNRAAEAKLSLFTCHSHPGAVARNQLSGPDLEAHRRVFPHLLDIVNGGAVGGIAFGENSAAGELWNPGLKPQELDCVEVIGPEIKRLFASPRGEIDASPRFDRQARMFGAEGQAKLRSATVAVIGAGGGGSMVIEQLAHLGIGSLIAVDYDVVKTHNLSRIMGATPQDVDENRKKVDVARDLVERIDPTIGFDAIDGDLADAEVAQRVAAADFVFLCTDTITSRLVANALAHSYFVPVVQIGAKVDLVPGRSIESIYVAVRPVFPGRGCLACAGLIDPAALQREAATDEERRAQNYLDLPDVVDPSVVTLNGVAASVATNLMLMTLVGLATDEYLAHRLFDARTGNWLALETKSDPDCQWCSRGVHSSFAMGSSAWLPVRVRQPSEVPIEVSSLRRFARVRRWFSKHPRTGTSDS
jgi:molybdopterin/thiamine biosynthesis adenylyltransferase